MALDRWSSALLRKLRKMTRLRPPARCRFGREAGRGRGPAARKGQMQTDRAFDRDHADEVRGNHPRGPVKTMQWYENVKALGPYGLRLQRSSVTSAFSSVGAKVFPLRS